MTEQHPTLSAPSVRMHYGPEAAEESMRHGHKTAPCVPWRPILLRSAIKQRSALCDVHWVGETHANVATAAFGGAPH
eukprot:7712367-Pyramimonas_sp.AAC.1